MRKLKNIQCINCGKIGVSCRGMCQACLSKEFRATPKGREYVKLYNSTKGKVNRLKYLSKFPPKPPRKIEPKPICQCGVISEVKGLCRKCYSRKYQREKFGYSERIKRETPYNKTDFNKILNEVKKGFTVQQACIKLNVDRNDLYKKMNKQQRFELKSYKILGSIIEVDEEY